MHPTRLDDSLEAIAGARNSADLIALARTLRDRYQLAHLVYAGLQIPCLPSQSPYLIVTYPGEWTTRYIRGRCFWNDPVVSAGRAAFHPIDWATLDQQAVTTESVISEAGRHGVGLQGVSLPIRGPHGDAAVFTFMASTSPDEWLVFRKRYTGEIALMGQYFHERVITILTGELRPARPHPLSPRELECLQFLVDGQAPKQIAATLNLSEAAVRLYLKRAKARLGAPSLLQAVIIAVRSNLVRAG